MGLQSAYNNETDIKGNSQKFFKFNNVRHPSAGVYWRGVSTV